MRSKLLLPGLLMAAVLAIATWLLAAGASAKTEVREPDKLVILSTSDVKGRTSPCG